MEAVFAEVLTFAIFFLPLKQILYIYYLVRFKKDQTKVQALLDSSNKVNVMSLAYAANLNLKIRLINVRAQKLNSFIFEIFKMVLANF